MEKADNLILIIGTNPMPNLITISNRVKDDGIVYLIYTKNYEKKKFSISNIEKSIEGVLQHKFPNLNVKSIEVNKNDEKSIVTEINTEYENLNGIIEVNYTGGTKLMASATYKYFKEKLREDNKKIILSYFDNIKNKFIMEHNLKGTLEYKEIYGDEEQFNNKFNIYDIAKVHCIDSKEEEDAVKNKDEIEDSFMYGHTLESLELEGKNKWIDELNACVKYKDKSLIKENLLNFAQKYVSEACAERIKNESDNYIIRFMLGEAFEGYFSYLLEKLKEENYIDEYTWSFKSKETEIASDIEVDFVIKQGYNITLISTTLVEDETCKFKMYEALTRASQISGDECNVIYVCLYQSNQNLYNYIKNNEIESKENVTIIARDNFFNMYESLKDVLSRGLEHE